MYILFNSRTYVIINILYYILIHIYINNIYSSKNIHQLTYDNNISNSYHFYKTISVKY